MRCSVFASLLAAGCVVEASDCDKLDTKRSCERAQVDFGECVWLEVRAPVVEEDGTCRTDVPTHGECIGLDADTNQGCGGVVCEGDRSGPAFFRTDGDRVETFVNPHCGGSVFGEWEACGETTAECACACAP